MLTLFVRAVMCNWMVSTGVVAAMMSTTVRASCGVWRESQAVSAALGVSVISNSRRAMPRKSAGTDTSSVLLPAKAFMAAETGCMARFSATTMGVRISPGQHRLTSMPCNFIS